MRIIIVFQFSNYFLSYIASQATKGWFWSPKTKGSPSRHGPPCQCFCPLLLFHLLLCQMCFSRLRFVLLDSSSKFPLSSVLHLQRVSMSQAILMVPTLSPSPKKWLSLATELKVGKQLNRMKCPFKTLCSTFDTLKQGTQYVHSMYFYLLNQAPLTSPNKCVLHNIRPYIGLYCISFLMQNREKSSYI